jgi:hypothetical protein
MIQPVMVSMIPIVGVPVSSDTLEEAMISFYMISHICSTHEIWD